jgi:hypothetical protein
MKNTFLIIAILAFALVGCEDLNQSSSKTTLLSTGIKLELEKIPSNSITEPYVTHATYYIPSEQKLDSFQYLGPLKFYEDYDVQITTRKRREDDAYDTYTITPVNRNTTSITIIEEKPFGEK